MVCKCKTFICKDLETFVSVIYSSNGCEGRLVLIAFKNSILKGISSYNQCLPHKSSHL